MPYLDPEQKKANAKAYREKNRRALADKQVARQRAAKESDPVAYSDAIKEKSRRWRKENLEKSRAKAREAGRRKYEKLKDTPEYKEKNRARVKAWRESNREAFNEKARTRRVKRYASDVQFKLSLCLRRRLYMAVKNDHRSGMAVRELGCSIAELKTYIEALFADGMTWENWGLNGWHLDHVKPLYRFDLTDEKEVARACHYTNLQPLWAAENVRKDSCRGRS